MMSPSEKATQRSTARHSRSVHHTSFLCALCHEFVLSTIQRWPAYRGAGWPFLAIWAFFEALTADRRIVAVI